MKMTKYSAGSIMALAAELFALTCRGGVSNSAGTRIPGRHSATARFLAVLLIILVVGSAAVRAEEDPVPTTQTPTTLETPTETAPRESTAEDVVWPPPFKPSEEIGADSQVSFPTDI